MEHQAVVFQVSGLGAPMLEAVGLIAVCVAAFVALVHFPAYAIGTVTMVVAVLAFIAGQHVLAFVCGLVSLTTGYLIRGSRKGEVRVSIVQQLRELPAPVRYAAVGGAVTAFLGLLSVTSRGQHSDLLGVLTMVAVAGGVGAAIGFFVQQWLHRERARR